jgi:hypothetical protein
MHSQQIVLVGRNLIQPDQPISSSLVVSPPVEEELFAKMCHWCEAMSARYPRLAIVNAETCIPTIQEREELDKDLELLLQTTQYVIHVIIGKTMRLIISQFQHCSLILLSLLLASSLVITQSLPSAKDYLFEVLSNT